MSSRRISLYPVVIAASVFVSAWLFVVSGQDAIKAGTQTLVNGDIVNTCAGNADGFRITVEDIDASDVTEIYNGSDNVFAPPNGSVTTVGEDVEIEWQSESTLVSPGNISHLGFDLADGVFPSSTTVEWLSGASTLCSTPSTHVEWSGNTATVHNDSSETLSIHRSSLDSSVSLDLDDLLQNTVSTNSASIVDASGVNVSAGGTVSYTFTPANGSKALLIIYDIYDSSSTYIGTMWSAK